MKRTAGPVTPEKVGAGVSTLWPDWALRPCNCLDSSNVEKSPQATPLMLLPVVPGELSASSARLTPSVSRSPTCTT